MSMQATQFIQFFFPNTSLIFTHSIMNCTLTQSHFELVERTDFREINNPIFKKKKKKPPFIFGL